MEIKTKSGKKVKGINTYKNGKFYNNKTGKSYSSKTYRATKSTFVKLKKAGDNFSGKKRKSTKRKRKSSGWR